MAPVGRYTSTFPAATSRVLSIDEVVGDNVTVVSMGKLTMEAGGTPRALSAGSVSSPFTRPAFPSLSSVFSVFFLFRYRVLVSVLVLLFVLDLPLLADAASPTVTDLYGPTNDNVEAMFYTLFFSTTILAFLACDKLNFHFSIRLFIHQVRRRRTMMYIPRCTCADLRRKCIRLHPLMEVDAPTTYIYACIYVCMYI